MCSMVQKQAARRFVLPADRVPIRLCLLACAVISGSTTGLSAAPPAQEPALTLVSQIRQFHAAGSGKTAPIRIRAVVTYYDSVAPNLFVQDETGGVWVDLRGMHDAPPNPGQLLDLQGIVGMGFTPYVAQPKWTVIGSSPLPKPVHVSYEQAATGAFDSRWVEMDGIVRSFSQEAEDDVLVIDAATPTGKFKVRVPAYHGSFPLSLVDAKVRFRGVCGAAFNQRNQLVAIHIMMPGLVHQTILQSSPADPFSVPTTAIRDIGRFSAALTDIHRIKVSGIVTARYPKMGLFLMDKTGGVYVESQDGSPLKPGDGVDVIGFPVAGDYSPILRSASIRPAGQHQSIVPINVTGLSALKGTHDAQLVTIAGTVQAITLHSTGYSLVLQSDDHISFETSFRGQYIPGNPPAIYTYLKLTGICSIKTDENGNPAAFEIVLRDPEDISVTSAPPWFTGRRASAIMSALAFSSAAILFWGMTLRKRVRRQTKLIKARLESELALEERYRRMFERNLTGLYVANTEGTIIDCNNTCAQILGYADRIDLLDHCQQAESITAQFHENLFDNTQGKEHRILNVEQRFKRHDGSWRWVLTNVRLVNQGEGSTLLIEGGLVDITDRKAAEEQVQLLAYYDALTGLPNRSMLKDRLAQALAAAQRHKEKVAILFLDLDRFKDINDSLGHSFGDLLLQEVARRLKKLSRADDTVARVGGDEFLIVLTSVQSAEDASIAADRVVENLGRDFEMQGQSFNVHCSIGISIYPDHGEDDETLIKHADAAMYAAKSSGRYSVRFFTEDMNADLVERLTLENKLRGALERNELYLVYQPQMDMATKNVIGLEALIRWQHPELGLVSPDRFIPVAESSGLIVPIGEWVLRTACAQARQWQDAGLVVHAIAVNVSAVQFRKEEFCAIVQAILEDTGLAPQYLELELTESVLLSNADLILSLLEELKRMGLKLAIDDFGTGYSSLSYLRQFPVGKLKIDRSFIKDVATNSDDAAITAAIIDMAKALSLKVIAEGVETEAQMSYLRSHNCDQVQGYLFSKPLTAENIEKEVILSQLT